jgi:tripartite ATP-independent transporter DctM subunit
MSATLAGICGIIAFLILLALKMPIAVSMTLVGFAGVNYLVSLGAAYRVLSSEIYTTFSSYPLSVTPMFILMGYFAFHAGIGNKLYSFAYKAIGRFHGGLAMASEVACAIFGAICGSSPATTATIGSIAIPEMRRYKYSDSLAASSVAAGGGLGILIPPSVPLVIYGLITEHSISRLFLASIVPGILLTFLYITAIWSMIKYNPSLGPAASGPRPSFREIVIAFRGGLAEVVIVFVISIGGLFAGFFTPTESGGIGAAGVLVVTLLKGDMKWEKFNRALRDTTRTTAMVMFLIAGATIFSRFITLSRLPFQVADWVASLPLPSYIILFVILAIYTFLGTFIDTIPLILITVPIFYPVAVDTLGRDPIWFGAMIAVIGALAVMTPPVGVNLFVAKGVAPDIPLEVILRGIWPFIIAAIICCMILIVFPQIVTFLPDLML